MVPAPNQKTPTPTPVKKPLNPIAFILFPLVLIILGAGSYYLYQKYYKKPPAPKEAEEKKAAPPLTLSLKSSLPSFASWNEEKVTITPSLPSYTLQADELLNLKDIEKAVEKPLSAGQKEALNNPGFFITPGENKLQNGEEQIEFRHGGAIDEMLMDYQDIYGNPLESNRRPENTVFITSDLLLHAYHVFLERTFEHIEEVEFQPKLLTLTDLLFQKSLAEYNNAQGKIKDSFARITTFYLVPKVILNTNEDLDSLKGELPDKIYQTAKAEIELINKAEAMAISPLFGAFRAGQLDDYTQYKPRSHYTKSSILRNFWKAMIWYGRNGFLVKSDELTLDAISQTILLNSLEKDGQTTLQMWESIYLPTVFFVGKSDDLTPYDYQKLIVQIYGSQVKFTDLEDQGKLNHFKDKVKDLAGPLIQSSIVIVEPGKTTEKEALEETKSWRFMGQRFIPDSFIFSSLTQGDTAPDKETGQKLPYLPTALEPFTILESQRAEIHLQDWIKTSAPESDKIIPKKINELKQVFAKLEEKDWTQNLYWSWLYTLKPLFQTFAQGYPLFMQSSFWDDKDLATGLGSWTELRHDTLLYAKQSYAELGAGGEPEEKPAVPKGYVEPNLVFLNRIIALAQMTKEGLEKNNVFPEEQKWKLDQMVDLFKFYRELAQKELQNQTISDDDFEKLRTSPLLLNQYLTPVSGSFMKASEARAGLIADVHTAVPSQQVLYEATGIPNLIWVAVKDTNGARLTRGVVYSYFEFTHEITQRLSDQDWQKVVYEEGTDFPLPSPPSWLKALEK